jgi:hypothetical protein
MARDDSASGLEAELAQTQAELAKARAENTALRTVVTALIEVVTPEQFGQARAKLEQLEPGEGAADEQPAG